MSRPDRSTSPTRRHNLTHKLLARHTGAPLPAAGLPLPVRFEQTLTQDASGPLVMQLLGTMGLDRTRAGLSVQYVDHYLVQQDSVGRDTHRLLQRACQQFGLWYSPPGNGVSHPLHMERFGVPGASLVGADSHTPAAGALGMLAVGASGADVALAISGEPVEVSMPAIWGVELTGSLPDWVSAKDLILEMLRRHGVAGALGRVIEYYGPGVARLSVPDRHVICHMGSELGATASVFPADDETRRYLERVGRSQAFTRWGADPGCDYDHRDAIDLSRLVPLIATPSSPGNVVPVAEVAGAEICQAYIGSSANPGHRDLAVAADIVSGKTIAAGVSFDINPATRQVLQDLIRDGRLGALVAAGGRLHQVGCNGGIGMGQAPAAGGRSLRTVPRNFPGRSGATNDRVYLCSPETAAASALTGRITDPRSLAMPCPRPEPPAPFSGTAVFIPPRTAATAPTVRQEMAPLPQFSTLPDEFELRVLLHLADDVSTDEILPAGLRTEPYRSDTPGIARFCFAEVDERYPARAVKAGNHMIVAGANYGQGSTREHSVLALRHLGLRIVVARSFARIHRQVLVNYGIVPLVFQDADDYQRIDRDEVLVFRHLRAALDNDERLYVRRRSRGPGLSLELGLSARQRQVLRSGGLINWLRARA